MLETTAGHSISGCYLRLSPEASGYPLALGPSSFAGRVLQASTNISLSETYQ